MNNNQILFIILLVFAVMACFRVLPLLFCKSKIKNKFLRSVLAYIPIAVLTSMMIPEVFHCTSSVMSAAIGTAVAVILAYFGQGLLVVSVSSVVTVFIVEQIMSFIH